MIIFDCDFWGNYALLEFRDHEDFDSVPYDSPKWGESLRIGENSIIIDTKHTIDGPVKIKVGYDFYDNEYLDSMVKIWDGTLRLPSKTFVISDILEIDTTPLTITNVDSISFGIYADSSFDPGEVFVNIYSNIPQEYCQPEQYQRFYYAWDAQGYEITEFENLELDKLPEPNVKVISKELFVERIRNSSLDLNFKESIAKHVESHYPYLIRISLEEDLRDFMWRWQYRLPRNPKTYFENLEKALKTLEEYEEELWSPIYFDIQYCLDKNDD